MREANVLEATETTSESNRLWPVRDMEWTTRPRNSSLSELDTDRARIEFDAKPVNSASASTAATTPELEGLTTLPEMKSAEWQVFFEELSEWLKDSLLPTFDDWLASSTSSSFPTSNALDTISVSAETEMLFSLATFIDLEPGMENAFSQGLEKLIARHGESALSEIQNVILGERTKSAIAMEALQYIGRMDSSAWERQRRSLLERCLLRSRSAWVRDGAGLGLASLDNPESIDVIELAIEKESSCSLKKDLESVLEQLQNTLSET